MSTAMQIRESAGGGGLQTPTAQEWDTLVSQAQMLVKTNFLPQAIKTAEQAIAIMLTGRELGIPSMAALRTIDVIQGKPTVSPQLMMALINRSGQLENVAIETSSDGAIVMMKRKGRHPHTESFMREDAANLGLLAKDNYKKQAPTMFKWRAIAACARVVFPDVILGLYTHDEMGLETEAETGERFETADVVDFPLDPVAKSIPDLVTAKQLGVIRTMSKELNIDAEEECQAVLGCNTDELSKRAASALIEHLKKLSEESALSRLRQRKETSPPMEQPPPEKQEEPETKDKTEAMRNKRGQGIAAMGLVSYKDNGYQVKTPGLRGKQVTYEVWRDVRGKIHCNCLEFEENSNDETYKCEHIYAVKHFVISQRKDSKPIEESPEQPAEVEWTCTPATRARVEAAINNIATHKNKNVMSKDDLLLALREKYERDDVPHGLSEAEAEAVAFSFEKYIDDLNVELEAEQRLQSNQGNNRGNAKRK